MNKTNIVSGGRRGPQHIPLFLLLAAGCNSDELVTSSGSQVSDSGTGSGTEFDPSLDTAPGPSNAPTSSGGADASDSHNGDTTVGISDSQSGTASTAIDIDGTSGGEDTTSIETSTGDDTTGGETSTGDDTTGGDTSTGEPGTSTTDECTAKIGPDPVYLGAEDDLGTAGAYVLLAQAAITNVPGSSIGGGHVGVSPAASTSITGFGLLLEPAGAYSTSSAVVAPWRIYAAEYTLPTPPNLTTAILGMQAAYTDAAGRVPTDHLNLANGNLGGLTLEPGIYTWGTSVYIPNDVTLEGCADDVWIFQISNDLIVSTDMSVILSGGAQAKNVFWQLAGQATIQVGAHFEGVILSKTGITFQTGATLNGRAMAQTMIALDMNAVTAP